MGPTDTDMKIYNMTSRGGWHQAGADESAPEAIWWLFCGSPELNELAVMKKWL